MMRRPTANCIMTTPVIDQSSGNLNRRRGQILLERAYYKVEPNRWYITVIHSLPIESWVVEDENHFGARPSTAYYVRGSFLRSCRRSWAKSSGQSEVKPIR